MVGKFVFSYFIILSSFVSAQHDTLGFRSSNVCWRHIPCFCNKGCVDQKTIQQAVNVNYIRLRSGLKEVTLSDSLSKLSQEAAFICHRNKKQNHRIDKSWKCYNAVRGLACRVSLLAYIGELALQSDSLFVTKGFFFEHGDENKRLLHRRWLMNPNIDSIGYGSTRDYEAITPFINENNRSKDFIKYTFPDQGIWDQEILSDKWSWTVYPYNVIDADSINVEVRCNDKKVPIKIICKDIFLGEFTLGFEIKNLYQGNDVSNRYLNQEIIVTVSGYKLGGVSKVDEYVVTIR
jgi:Cysteine-rich secretory protein family